jgi:hypothetical protein
MSGHVDGGRRKNGKRPAGADHRLLTYRTPGGDLMCLAQAGALSSEARVTASLCGTDAGCRGMWRCFRDSGFAIVSKN